MTILAAACEQQESMGSDIAVASVFLGLFALVGFMCWIATKSSR